MYATIRAESRTSAFKEVGCPFTSDEFLKMQLKCLFIVLWDKILEILISSSEKYEKRRWLRTPRRSKHILNKRRRKCRLNSNVEIIWALTSLYVEFFSRDDSTQFSSTIRFIQLGSIVRTSTKHCILFYAFTPQNITPPIIKHWFQNNIYHSHFFIQQRIFASKNCSVFQIPNQEEKKN